MTLIPFGGRRPIVHPGAFVAPGARLIGDVEVGEGSSIWYNVVVRGDVNRVRIGQRTNIQDGSVIHVDSPKPGRGEGHPTLIGDEVLVGHMAVIHGCILHDRAFVGLGAIVVDGCEVEGMLAAGAMLTPGRKVPRGQLWAGRPAKYLRDLSDEELAGQQAGIDHYAALARAHAEAIRQV